MNSIVRDDPGLNSQTHPPKFDFEIPKQNFPLEVCLHLKHINFLNYQKYKNE